MEATLREVAVARMIYRGHTTKEVANIMCVSPHTIVSHKRNLFGKIGARNVADLCRWYTCMYKKKLNELFEAAA